MNTLNQPGKFYAAIAFNIQLDDVVMTRAQSEKLQDDLNRALKLALVDNPLFTVPRPPPEHEIKSPCPVHVIAAGSLVCGMLFVPDLQNGLATVEAELKRAKLFAGAEIGWRSPVIDDCTERRWHRYPEETAAGPYSPKILEGKAELIAIVNELGKINPDFARLPSSPRPTLTQRIVRRLLKALQAVLQLFIFVNTKILRVLAWILARCQSPKKP
jgi:hypothetical protein